MNDLTFCKYCNKSIIFLRTKRGKSMPCDSFRVDYVPDQHGKDSILNEDGEIVYGWILEKAADDAEKGYRYDNPFFNIKWPLEPPYIISDKDKTLPLVNLS